nr:hypothetical protein [Tanacetum cinerariifolium]
MHKEYKAKVKIPLSIVEHCTGFVHDILPSVLPRSVGQRYVWFDLSPSVEGGYVRSVSSEEGGNTLSGLRSSGEKQAGDGFIGFLSQYMVSYRTPGTNS